MLPQSPWSIVRPSDADFSLMAARMGCKQFGCAHTVALTTSAVMAEMANAV